MCICLDLDLSPFLQSRNHHCAFPFLSTEHLDVPLRHIVVFKGLGRMLIFSSFSGTQPSTTTMPFPGLPCRCLQSVPSYSFKLGSAMCWCWGGGVDPYRSSLSLSSAVLTDGPFATRIPEWAGDSKPHATPGQPSKLDFCLSMRVLEISCAAIIPLYGLDFMTLLSLDLQLHSTFQLPSSVQILASNHQNVFLVRPQGAAASTDPGFLCPSSYFSTAARRVGMTKSSWSAGKVHNAIIVAGMAPEFRKN